MSPNFNYFEINTGDIWEYEKEQYLSKDRNEKSAEEFIEKIQVTIISNGVLSFDQSLYENGDKSVKAYYERNIRDYMNANLDQKFILDYFIHRDRCYEYAQDLLINPESEGFDYFVLPTTLHILDKYRGHKRLLLFADMYGDFKNLNKIGYKKLKLKTKLTTCYAQHSWATITSQLDISRDVIIMSLEMGLKA
jgi:hypothetical protein